MLICNTTINNTIFVIHHHPAKTIKKTKTDWRDIKYTKNINVMYIFYNGHVGR